MNRRALINVSIIAIAAIVGLSLAKVSSENPWVLSVGAAVIAAIAIAIAKLFRPQTISFEKATPPRKLFGLRIGVVGGGVALSGWLVAVFLSALVGYYVAVVGVITGLVGCLIHFYNMYCYE